LTQARRSEERASSCDVARCEDAKSAGRVRAKLEKAGTPIGTYDILIAAQAVRRNITLLTANVREFSRVSGLHWQNWNKP
jgi:tRNA(fMet)-specific endonuclease VapC